MTREPKVTHAPWRQIEQALTKYEASARRWRNLSYLLFLLLALSGALLLFTVDPQSAPGQRYAPLAYGLLAASLLPRLAFSLWSRGKTPRCPGCESPLGWDFRGSSARARQVREEHACPSCGIPFVATSEDLD